jgi:hypothetical protein
MILIGNSFPLSLIRREVAIRPVDLNKLKQAVAENGPICSFWGHRNTLAPASDMLGSDLSPAGDRPVLSLSPEGLPMLEGATFRDCWILSPDYIENFRPQVGEEVPAEKIRSWQVLHMQWHSGTPASRLSSVQPG